MNGRKLADLDYADVIRLMNAKQEQMSALSKRFDGNGKKVGLGINVGKNDVGLHEI